jgi:hypothetical protein
MRGFSICLRPGESSYDEEQSARHRERERRVVNEPVPARDIVRLINQLGGQFSFSLAALVTAD